ncbi:MAG: FHA domain-containing protein [Polyangiaceae bacterium]
MAPVAPVAGRLCPRCRAPSEDAAQFCRTCGAPLAEAQAPRLTPSPAAAHPVAAIPQATPGRPSPGAAPATGTAQASLVILARDGGEGPAFPLGETTDIGRSEGHFLVAEDAYISPRHARITQRGSEYYLRDLGSTNGIFLRIPAIVGEEVSGAPAPNLKDQDLFLAGQQVLRFEVVKDAEEGFGVASDNGTLLFGTPASPRYGRLVQRTVEGVTRDIFNLRKAETVLGRESGDIVFTDDPFLSRRHALLRVNLPPAGNKPDKNPERTYSLYDLGSSNGTFLKVHEEVRLRNGDQFRIGQQLFRFDVSAVPGLSVGAPAPTAPNPRGA